MAGEKLEQIDNSENQVSDQQITEMFDNFDKSEDKDQKELGKFGKEFQNHLKNKEGIIDKNDELVAGISAMKGIKEPKSQELAMQILTKVPLSAKYLQDKVQSETGYKSFLKIYIDLIKENKLTDALLKKLKEPGYPNELSGKLKTLYESKNGVGKPITFPVSFNPTTALAVLPSTTEKSNFTKKEQAKKNKDQLEKNKEEQQAAENFAKTKECADKLTQKYHLEIGENEQNEQLQKLGISEKEVEDKIKQSPYAGSGLKVSDFFCILWQ